MIYRQTSYRNQTIPVYITESHRAFIQEGIKLLTRITCSNINIFPSSHTTYLYDDLQNKLKLFIYIKQ